MSKARIPVSAQCIDQIWIGRYILKTIEKSSHEASLPLCKTTVSYVKSDEKCKPRYRAKVR